VILSYRGEALSRAKPANRARLSAAERSGKLQVLLNSNVRRILARSVLIEHAGRETQVENDAVIVSAGGVLPSEFLRRVGIHVEAKFGTA